MRISSKAKGKRPVETRRRHCIAVAWVAVMAVTVNSKVHPWLLLQCSSHTQHCPNLCPGISMPSSLKLLL